MEQTEALTMIVIMPVFFGGMAWAFNALLKYYKFRRISKMAFELQNKVIDKFGTAPEVLQYLESDAGGKFLEGATTGVSSPRHRILSSVQYGIISAALGVGFLAVNQVMTEKVDAFPFVGILALCLGLGFLVSAVAAHYLSKSWGLINGATGVVESDS